MILFLASQGLSRLSELFAISDPQARLRGRVMLSLSENSGLFPFPRQPESFQGRRTLVENSALVLCFPSKLVGQSLSRLGFSYRFGLPGQAQRLVILSSNSGLVPFFSFPSKLGFSCRFWTLSSGQGLGAFAFRELWFASFPFPPFQICRLESFQACLLLRILDSLLRDRVRVVLSFREN